MCMSICMCVCNCVSGCVHMSECMCNCLNEYARTSGSTCFFVSREAKAADAAGFFAIEPLGGSGTAAESSGYMISSMIWANFSRIDHGIDGTSFFPFGGWIM